MWGVPAGCFRVLRSGWDMSGRVRIHRQMVVSDAPLRSSLSSRANPFHHLAPRGRKGRLRFAKVILSIDDQYIVEVKGTNSSWVMHAVFERVDGHYSSGDRSLTHPYP